MKNFEEFGDICARNFIIGVKLILSHTVEIQKKGEKLSFPRVIFQLKAVNIGFMFKSDDQPVNVSLNDLEDVPRGYVGLLF